MIVPIWQYLLLFEKDELSIFFVIALSGVVVVPYLAAGTFVTDFTCVSGGVTDLFEKQNDFLNASFQYVYFNFTELSL